MEKNRGTIKIIHSLFKMLPKRQWFILAIIFILAVSTTEIASAYFIQVMTDSAISKDLSQFYYTLIFLLILTVFEISFIYFRTKLLGNYSESGLKFIREKLSNQYNQLDMETFTTNHTGDYVSRATNDVNKVKNFLNDTFAGLIWYPLTGIGAFVYLLIFSWKLTLVSLAVIPIVFIGVNLLSKPLTLVSKKLQEKLGVANSHIQDYIKGVEVSKAYQLEGVLGENYYEIIDESVGQGKKIAKKRALINSFSNLFSLIPFFITFSFGGYLVINGEMSVGDLLAFINLLNYVTNPIIVLPRLFTTAKVDLAACSRIFDMLDSKTERTDGQIHKINNHSPIIEFKNVDFKYSDQTDLVLKDINLSINRGESIALVGPSGGGKSTIMRMLLGYYNHYEGSINIYGEELKTWNLTELRRRLSLVSQDTYLFPDSIEENISYGKLNEEISFDEIQNAAKIANAHHFIESLPNQYLTPIGELGNRLSGGERQRLSIARAVIKNSEILLLDEATSSLDNESESLVQEALERLMKNTTSIVIAHRLSTIKNVDRILVIDDGKIVEVGTHQQLLSKDGIYKGLYQKQMKIENEEEGKVA
ncbi:ABC transporter ATP-binding protein [Mycoplasmatota bacterium]|nr:ABC transporter ATP-binding protein [Mycoplasmatota bacterium]